MSAEPTVGPVHANEYGSVDDSSGAWVPVFGVTLLSGNSAKALEAIANRDLFIEAINVHTETGLTPRELAERNRYLIHGGAVFLEQFDTLLAACRLASRYLDPSQYPDAARTLDAAISKAEDFKA